MLKHVTIGWYVGLICGAWAAMWLGPSPQRGAINVTAIVVAVIASRLAFDFAWALIEKRGHKAKIR